MAKTDVENKCVINLLKYSFFSGDRRKMFPIWALVLIFGSFLEVISGKDPRKCLSVILEFLPCLPSAV